MCCTGPALCLLSRAAKRARGEGTESSVCTTRPWARRHKAHILVLERALLSPVVLSLTFLSVQWS